jgi:hypothetical protein
MRLPILFGSVLVITAAGFSSEANAQGIKLGKLKQLTAPFVGGNIELMAIGYDGDTSETEEATSLYGFTNDIDLQDSKSISSWAFVETIKPNGDCLTCELRSKEETILPEDHSADLRRY